MTPHQRLGLLIALAVFLLAGCAHPVFKMQPIIPPAEEPLWRGRPSIMEGAEYFSDRDLRKRFCLELATTSRDCENESGPPYEVGLALSGGGAKAASYAMGVLAGLHREGILQKNIDIISTVSGGGYAALWYYSRLTDLYLDPLRYTTTRQQAKAQQAAQQASDHLDPTAPFFEDCIPWKYAGLLGLPPGSVTGEGEYQDICPAGDPRAFVPQDKFRYQNHLRQYADVFSNDFGERPERLQGDVGKALGLTLVTLPGHLFANILFDWNLEVSPSQRQYRQGIERTFGLPPVNLSDGCGSDIRADGTANCESVRPVPNHLVGRGLTFSTLQLTRGEGEARRADDGFALPRVPFLVVNTTAGVSATPFDLLEQKLPDFEDSVFEFTPTGYGSRLYGYWPGSHPEVDVVTAVSASAAFFDSQQRSYGGVRRFFIGAGLRFFQLDWGLDIANPWQPDRVRGLHKALPFPFYYFHRQTKNPNAPDIHLADGGQSDNTGIFSLVRRGVRTILFADAAQDTNGKFKDLCVLQQKLQTKSLYLFMPGLKQENLSFSEQCEEAKNPRYAAAEGHSPWKMAKGALQKGCITRNASDTTCLLEDTGGYGARLYVLKPSLNMEKLKPALMECHASAQKRLNTDTGTKTVSNDAFYATKGTPECVAAFNSVRKEVEDFPAEIFGFLSTSRNWNPNLRSTSEAQKNPVFPQHPTWLVTLDSSPWTYGAYRELGRWHVSQLLEELREKGEGGVLE